MVLKTCSTFQSFYQGTSNLGGSLLDEIDGIIES